MKDKRGGRNKRKEDGRKKMEKGRGGKKLIKKGLS